MQPFSFQRSLALRDFLVSASDYKRLGRHNTSLALIMAVIESVRTHLSAAGSDAQPGRPKPSQSLFQKQI